VSKYDHVTPGQPFKPPAEVWNSFLDLAAGSRRSRFHTGEEADYELFGQTVVDADDGTGASLERFQIVGLDTPPVLPSGSGGIDAFITGLRFAASVPSLTTHRRKWGIIARTPCLSGATISVIIAGLAVAKVTINSTSHPYATVTNSDRTKLASALVGCAEILWAAGTSGDQWCILRLGKLQHQAFLGKPGSTIAQGSSGTMTGWTKSSGSWAAAASTAAFSEPVEAPGGDLTAAKFCAADWIDDRWVATQIEC